MLLGLAQVVTTFAVTIWYVHFANKQFDPLAEQIRDEVERRHGCLGVRVHSPPRG